MRKTTSGFTIVELLIVVVVIAILAAISLVAYTNIQGRARDSQRLQDIKTIAKALDLYYIDNGRHPASTCGSSCVINGSWSTTNDNGWAYLANILVPKYISSLPSDPRAQMGNSVLGAGSYGYGYFSHGSTGYCGVAVGQAFTLVYKLESSAQKNETQGDCTVSPTIALQSGNSNHRVVR